MGKVTVSKQTLLLFQGNLGEYLQGFIIERQSRQLATGTIEYYRNELQRFTGFLQHNQVNTIEEITPAIIRYFLLELAATRNKGGVHASFRAIRAYLNWYEQEFEPTGWKNPIRKVTPPSPSKEPRPGIELATIHKLIDQCTGAHGQRNKTMLIFLLDSGLRAEELLSLKVADINLVTGSVEVQHGKGDKRRTVYVGRDTLREVRRYLQERQQVKSASALFATKTGERFTYNGLVTLVRELAKKAGVPRPGLHDFRRAFALNMLRNGCDLVTLSRLMGHADLQVLKRYLALSETDLREAHQRASPARQLTK